MRWLYKSFDLAFGGTHALLYNILALLVLALNALITLSELLS